MQRKRCDLIFRYNSTKNSGYLSAPKTSADATYGLTFYDCRLLSEEGCSGNKYRLGRPWGADGYLTFINTYMGQIVNKEESYDDMSGNSFMKARFFEYGSYGPGFAINEKRRQISPSRADAMLSAACLGWEPEKEVKTRSFDYKGEIFTNEAPKFVTAEYSQGKWYYLQPSYGGMATGWILADEKWYYLNPEKGDCLIDRHLALIYNELNIQKSPVEEPIKHAIQSERFFDSCLVCIGFCRDGPAGNAVQSWKENGLFNCIHSKKNEVIRGRDL